MYGLHISGVKNPDLPKFENPDSEKIPDFGIQIRILLEIRISDFETLD
jgi:hypothetical protein